MTQKSRIITTALTCLFLATAGVFSPAWAQKSSPADADPTKKNILLLNGAVLQVNDDAITSTEVLASLQSQLSEWAEKMSRTQFLARARDTLTENTMINLRNMLLYQHAKSVLEKNENYEAALEMQIADKQKELVAAHGGSEAQTQAELARYGTSIEQEMDKLKRNIVTLAYQQTYFIPSLEITRTQIMRYYRTHLKEKYYQNPTIQFQLIEIHTNKFLTNPDPTDETQQQAHIAAAQAAREALQKIKAGGDYDSIVKQYSHGFRLENDGLSRPLSPDSLHERYQPVIEALEKIEIGQCTPVIETPDRFFLAKLIDRQDAKVKPFSEAQNEISDLLREQKWQKHSAKLITKLWTKAIIGDIKRFVDEMALISYEQLKPGKP